MPADVSIKALAERLRGLRGWRRRLAALAAGAASVLAMAPFFVWPVLWLTLPALVWLIDGALSPRAMRQPCRRAGTSAPKSPPPRSAGGSASAISWRACSGSARPSWSRPRSSPCCSPLRSRCCPAGLALFYAAAARHRRAASGGPAPSRVLVLALDAVGHGVAARACASPAFPGTCWAMRSPIPLPLMQSAAVLGIYGLTLVAVLVFALPPVLWAEAPAGIAGRRAKVAALAVALVPLLSPLCSARCAWRWRRRTTVPGVKIRIVQPSVPQREKWRPENQGRIFLDHLALSAANAAGERRQSRRHHARGLAGSRHAVPAARLSRRARRHRPHAAARRPISSPARCAPSRRRPARRGRGASSTACSCSAQGGSLTTLYDKIHLVPFGEYLPLQRLLEAIGLRAAHPPARRLRHRRGAAAAAARAGPARRGAAHLLRGDLSARHRAGRRAAGAHAQRHQRRLVRQYHRAAPAPAPGARARGRGGVAAHARRQQRHFRRRRWLRPDPGAARSRRSRRDRRGAARSVAAAALCALGRYDLSHAVADRRWPWPWSGAECPRRHDPNSSPIG